MMWIDMLAKDDNSNPTGSPAVYIAQDGSLVVQGPAVDDDTRGNLKNMLPGEDAVHIPPEVVAAAIARYQRGSA